MQFDRFRIWHAVVNVRIFTEAFGFRSLKASHSRTVLREHQDSTMLARLSQFLLTAALFSTVFADEENVQASGRNLERVVDCGVCKNVPESTCKWCSGTGGVAPVSSVSSVSYGGSGTCAAGLVNCGVCRCTYPTACAYCDGKGGSAPIIANDAASITMGTGIAILCAFAAYVA